MTAWERFYYGVIAVALICGTALLGACEGDGFRNGGQGYRNSKACKEVTPWGERWYRC